MEQEQYPSLDRVLNAPPSLLQQFISKFKFERHVKQIEIWKQEIQKSLLIKRPAPKNLYQFNIKPRTLINRQDSTTLLTNRRLYEQDDR